MKNKLLTTAMLVLLPMAATAGEDMYFRLDTGYSFTSDMKKDIGSYDAGTSPIIGAGLGYKVSDQVRVDATLGYRWNYDVSGSSGPLSALSGSSIDGAADIDSLVGLVNAYYDIGTYGRFTPYVGAGIGFARNHVGSTNVSVSGTSVGSVNSHTDTSFAWQLSAGTAVDIAHNLKLDVGYRYLDMGDAKTGDDLTVSGTPYTGATLKGNLRASEVMAGLRYSF